MVMTLILVHLGYLGTGMLIVRLSGFFNPDSGLRQVLISYLLGLVTHVSILYAVAAAWPVPHALALVVTVVGDLLFVCFFVAAARDLRRRKREIADRTETISRRPFFPIGWVKVLLVLLLIPPMLSTLMIGQSVPVFGWDGIAIWASKSAALFYGQSLRSEYFTDEDRIHAHPGYPVGLPLFQFHHTAVQGSFDEVLVTGASLVVFFLWLLAFFDLLREFAGETVGLAVCVILMYTPIFFSPAAMASPLSGFADFPIGALVVVSVGWFHSWLQYGKGVNLLGSVAALIAASGVKNEGMVWVALILGMAVVSIVVLRVDVKKRDLRWMLVPVVALVLMRSVHAHLPTSSDVHFPSLLDMKRVFLVVPRLAEIATDALSWHRRPMGLLPIIAVVGLGLGMIRNWRNKDAVFALVAPLMWLIIFMVMGLTDVQLGSLDRFVRVTLPRLLIQSAPVSIYWAIVLNSPLFPGERPLIRD